MPYIPQERREALKTEDPKSFGELNFLITSFLLCTDPKSYEDYQALIGLLECIKLEFYRRAVATYEDEKIKQHGDVYPS